MDGDLSDSWPLLIRDLHSHLRRQKDREVLSALQVGIELSRDFSPAEIRERLGLEEAEFRRAHQDASRALAELRR